MELAKNSPERARIISNLLRIAKEELGKGNKSITPEKLNQLSGYLNQSNNTANFPNALSRPYSRGKVTDFSSAASDSGVSDTNTLIVHDEIEIEIPTSQYAPLYTNFSLKNYKVNHPYYKPHLLKQRPAQITSLINFEKIENGIINSLESLTSLLDNLNLITRFKTIKNWRINYILKQTNKVWLLMLIFIIRKILSELITKTRKVSMLKKEFKEITKDLDRFNKFDDLIFDKYETTISDLQKDIKILYFELAGNLIDLLFVFTDLFRFNLPGWISTILNLVSGIMSIYRMNKNTVTEA